MGDRRVNVTTIAAGLWVLAHELLLLSAAGLLVFALDELFVDFVYFLSRFTRRVTVYRRAARWTAGNLPRGEGRFAIFIPAWDEAAVIARMLKHLTATLDYERYDIYVGVYPNDPETRAAAAAVPDHRIRLVETERAGPTTKADCLNHL